VLLIMAALAVPVTLKGRSGSYLYGLCGQGSLLLAGVMALGLTACGASTSSRS